jgi:hypothetical protein
VCGCVALWVPACVCARVCVCAQDRIRSYLHIVLCLSPVGDRLRQRVRTFPGLVNNCTIDWYRPWPVPALNSVAMRFLSSLSDVLSDGVASSVAVMCTFVHTTMVRERRCRGGGLIWPWCDTLAVLSQLADMP